MSKLLFFAGVLFSRLVRHPLAAASRRAARHPVARNALVLSAFWGGMFHQYGAFWAAFLTPLVALYFPWRGPTDRAASRVPTAAPTFDEAAFVASLAPLPDADLRRMADGLALALSGPLSARERQDRAQQRRLIYRALDERRANRPARGSAPPRQKGP